MVVFKKLFGKLINRLEKRPRYQQFLILGSIVFSLLLADIALLMGPQEFYSAITGNDVPITAEEAEKLVRSAPATSGKAVPIAPDTDCNAWLNVIDSDVRMSAKAGGGMSVFTYGPAGVASLPSLDGFSTAFDAACVDTVSESLKSRGFGIERVELSPAKGTGRLIVSWESAAASK